MNIQMNAYMLTTMEIFCMLFHSFCLCHSMRTERVCECSCSIHLTIGINIADFCSIFFRCVSLASQSVYSNGVFTPLLQYYKQPIQSFNRFSMDRYLLLYVVQSLFVAFDPIFSVVVVVVREQISIQPFRQ